MPIYEDITGKTFGKLIVLGKLKRHKADILRLCLCQCGKKKFLPIRYLKNGNTKSCGCHKREYNRLSKLEDKNPNWKGNKKISHSTLHQWLRRRLTQPKECPNCHKKFNSLDLANKNNIYTRNTKNWEWLCRKCHMTKDGRIDGVKKGQKYI